VIPARTPRTRALQRALAAAVLILLLLASAQTVRLAWADMLSRSPALEDRERAAALYPSADHYLRLAEKREATTGDSFPDVARAAALEPENPDVLQRLGMRAELAGDLATAERSLLRAASFSTLYQPRYLLAQFYFRHPRGEAFDTWFAGALKVSYGYVGPLLALAGRLRPDPAWLVELGLRQRPAIAREFLLYLRENGQAAASARLALSIARRARPADLPVLFPWMDELLEAGNAAPALEVWNALAAAGRVQGGALDPARPRLIALAPPPSSGRGFAWSFVTTSEVRVAPAGGELHLTLSGNQPEFQVLAWQNVPVLPGALCRLEFDAQTMDGGPSTGISGMISSRSGRREWEELPAGRPAPGALVRANLIHRRPLGSARISGTVSIRNLRLECAP
jgi:hypothetical protein